MHITRFIDNNYILNISYSTINKIHQNISTACNVVYKTSQLAVHKCARLSLYTMMRETTNQLSYIKSTDSAHITTAA